MTLTPQQLRVQQVTDKVFAIVMDNTAKPGRTVCMSKDEWLISPKYFNTIAGRHELETTFKIDFDQEQVDAWTTVQNIVDDVLNLLSPAVFDPQPELDKITDPQQRAIAEKLCMGRTYGNFNGVDGQRVYDPREFAQEQAEYRVGETSPEAIMPPRSKEGKWPASTIGKAIIAAGVSKRNTFTIPDGYEAVRGSDGRATGEVRPVSQKAINSLSRDDVTAFKEMMQLSVDSMSDYQQLATKSAIYPGQGTPLGLAYVALKLNGEAGEFAEHVGKAMRDDDLMRSRGDDQPGWHSASDALTQERRALIIKEASDVLWYLSAACNELGITMSELALTNLEKLADRTERNALRGSGDER